MRYAIRLLGTGAALIALASCASMDRKGNPDAPATVSAVAPEPQTVSDATVKLGVAYTIDGTTYTPQDTPLYDEVGYTSHYGAELAGRPTANGEIFNAAAAGAAHKTLPMPSYVEVTSLDTGRTILVRINDRGPFANDRLIDLSEGAAKQLGIATQGVAGVRVRRVNPPEQEKSVLRQGLLAAERIETPGPLLKVLRDKLAKQSRPAETAQTALAVAAKPADTKKTAATDAGHAPKPKAPPQSEPAVKGDYFAQIGAFSSRTRADALARNVGASVTATNDSKLFRVRLGPFATAAEAAAAARERGYPQARVYRD
jgi:rare lipoprotein A